MKIKWLDTGEVDRFAQWVVAELTQRLPAASLGPADKKLTDRVRRMNEIVSERARALAVGERLNFYKRARLANKVKWGLREAGYPEAFVDTFTYELATLITVASRSRSAAGVVSPPDRR
jgi:hypothetical protein